MSGSDTVALCSVEIDSVEIDHQTAVTVTGTGTGTGTGSDFRGRLIAESSLCNNGT